MAEDEESETSEKEAEQLLAGSKDQTRHGAEAAGGSAANEKPLSLSEAIVKHHAAIDAGEKTEQMAFRDERIIALLRGLEDSGQIDELNRNAEAALGRDQGNVEARAGTLRLLVRIGLQEIAPDAVQTAIEARHEYQSEHKNEF